MKVLPDARLQVVVPCDDHHSFTPHGDCKGPTFWITLDYDKPLAEIDCKTEIVSITVDQVIHAAFAALPEPPTDDE